MTCIHIRKVVKKMNEIIEKIGNDNGDLYKNLGTYIKKEEIKIFTGKRYNHQYFQEEENVEENIFGFSYKNKYDIKTIDEKVLGKYLSEIGELINDCDCYNELARNSVSRNNYNVLAEKAKNLQDKYNDLVDRFNDLDTKHQKLKEECDEVKQKLHDEKLKYAKDIGDEKLKHKDDSATSDKKIARLEETKKELKSVRIDSENEYYF